MAQSIRNAGPVRQTVCLCMIVKNEAPVIRRCIDSVRPLITNWVIVDTGSTDGTQDIIREALRDLPGKLYERPWRDFAFNRSEALELARGNGDYALIIDADDMMDVPDGYELPVLTEDSYTVDIHFGTMLYQRTHLVSNRLRWYYKGVLHEYIECDGKPTVGHLDVVMRVNNDGARRRDTQTYRRDAEVLERALKSEADPFLRTRYTFYLAQSYRDCGEPEKAIRAYQKRAKLGGWVEEVYMSLLYAARIMEQQGYPDDQVLAAYQSAIETLPARAEAIYSASRFCRLKGLHAQGYDIARTGLGLALPPKGLFAEPWVYDTGLLDEFAVNAYWSGHPAECLEACIKLLEGGKLAPDQLSRIAANARYARDQIGQQAKPPNLGRHGEANYTTDHRLDPPPPKRDPDARHPRVLVSILAKQKEPALPLYLQCIENLDYPKSSIVLYIRTNNNRDRTEAILRDWVARVGAQYAAVEFDAAEVTEQVQNFGVHEWNPVRFKVLGHIRNVSLRKAEEHDCDFYFVADVDNFVRPGTLSALVDLNLPIVAPLLRAVSPLNPYSNYHAEIDANGYYAECDQYYWILNRWIRGIIEVPVVHCTYLIRRDAISRLTYMDETDRYEYVVFSHAARKAGIPQYFDNRHIYGYIAFDEGAAGYVEGGFEIARTLMAGEEAYREPPAAEVFSSIYRSRAWGDPPDGSAPFYSGPGSHDQAIVGSYVTGVTDFLRSLGSPDVVDLGCGDFTVGKQIRPACGRYIACDVVPDLIAFNRWTYKESDVDFRVLDIVEDELPEGQVVILRQVLQHLGNAAIARVLAKVAGRYRYLLLTEHLPSASGFIANVDIPTGAGIRLSLSSGVVVTRPPFNLKVVAEKVLAETTQFGGILRTVAYTLPAAGE